MPVPAAAPISKAASMRCASACHIPCPRPPLGPRYERLPRPRPPPKGVAPPWRIVRRRPGRKGLLGRRRRPAAPRPKGQIAAGLRKLNRGSGWRMVIDPEGQRAVTDYRVLGAAQGRAWLELRPRTGRTHQIRVHCAALGCPVVGDPVYGRAPGPLLLHARSISLAALCGAAADRGHRPGAAAHARRPRPPRI